MITQTLTHTDDATLNTSTLSGILRLKEPSHSQIKLSEADPAVKAEKLRARRIKAAKAAAAKKPKKPVAKKTAPPPPKKAKGVKKAGVKKAKKPAKPVAK